MARSAVLAVCLLALAAGASAQCTEAGLKLRLDFLGKANAAPSEHPIAVCLTGMIATIVDNGGCALQIEPQNSGGSYIEGLWSGRPGQTYKQYVECPTTAGHNFTLAAVDSATIKTELVNAIAAFPYGWDDANAVAKKGFTVALDFLPLGEVKATITLAAGTEELFYAVTEITLNQDPLNLLLVDDPNGDAMTVVPPACDGVTLVAGVDACIDLSIGSTDWLNANGLQPAYFDTAGAHLPCDDNGYNNAYGHILGEAPNQYKMCSLCPAGTSGTSSQNGFGCTTCPAGTASLIGGDCNPCPLGTYAQAGSSTCLPCPTGTYAGTEGTKECTECPEDTYAWIPGSQYCMRCIAGIPEACPLGVCPSGSATAAPSSPATMVLRVAAAPASIDGLDAVTPATCALNNAGVTALTPAIPEWEIFALDKCTTWTSVAPTTTGSVGAGGVLQFALRVAGDCSIQISPITDETCADPTDPRNDQADPSYDATIPTYGQIEMRAYYAPSIAANDTTKANFRIMSLFDTFADGQTAPQPPNRTVENSPMISIVPNGGTTFQMYMFAATSKPELSVTGNAFGTDAFLTEDSTANGATNVCIADLNLEGGELIGVSTGTTDCPAGSYYHATEKCVACPPGYHCPGGPAADADKIPCQPNEYNQFYGMPDACEECAAIVDPADPAQLGYTSYEGAASCSVERVDLQCRSVLTSGYQYDLASQECQLCPPGTARDYNDLTRFDCQLCPAGTYSDEGAFTTTGLPDPTACKPCPIGQYNPLEGLPNQFNITGLNCIACAVGSVALSGVQTADLTVDNDGALTDTSTFCEACPAGTTNPSAPVDPNAPVVSTDLFACTSCAATTYRAGDATPENNVCKPIPAGYRLIPPGGGVLAHSEIELCPAGQVSFYAAELNGTRVPGPLQIGGPGSDTECIACSGLDAALGLVAPNLKWAHTYAMRKGMTQCVPCPGGTVPSVTNDGPAGSDRTASCVACLEGDYRDAYTISATCDTCPGGREVGPNNKMACTDCRPGFYMTDARAALNTVDANTCDACQANTYRPTFGAKSCLPCPRGTGTTGTGNVECTSCPIGYYSNIPGGGCVPAPAGNFVNVTGSFVTTPCPRGSWNNEQAQDNCNPCAPGKYSNVLGAKECKTCAAGTYSAGQATTCMDCKPGYASSAGASACSPCKPGTYAPDSKSATCKLCPKGFQCPTNAMRKEGPCPRGTFSNKEGNRLCTPCPVNTYSMGGGTAASPFAVMACVKCAPGTNTRGLVGQSRCQVIRPQVRRLL